ncbi:DNA-directed RNA polymerase beta' subunit [Elusimicrobium simillimum]|uniref:hypothetical protein n=1 Tax=Elusimicrobium simillimum TaxID=3143438 RepID=UPI003C6F6BB7
MKRFFKKEMHVLKEVIWILKNSINAAIKKINISALVCAEDYERFFHDKEIWKIDEIKKGIYEIVLKTSPRGYDEFVSLAYIKNNRVFHYAEMAGCGAPGFDFKHIETYKYRDGKLYKKIFRSYKNGCVEKREYSAIDAWEMASVNGSRYFINAL